MSKVPSMVPQKPFAVRRRALTGSVAAMLMLPQLALAATCMVDTSGAAIAFGPYDPFAAAPIPALGTIVVTCEPPKAKDLPVTFALGPGNNSTNFAPRRMQAAAGQYLDYNLYTAGYAAVFGDGTSGTSTRTEFTGGGGGPYRATAQIWGELPAGQNAAAGSYSDTITVTVTF